MTGFFRQLLMQHFANANNIKDHQLKSAIWNKNPTESKILIDSQNKRRELVVGQRPAIIIKRNSIKKFKLGIADYQSTDKRGHESFTVAWLGSHTLFCKNESGGSSEVLGEEVEEFITENSPELIRRFGLLRCEVVTVDAAQEIEEDKEVGVVPVTVGWALQKNWKIERETPKIFRIGLKAMLE